MPELTAKYTQDKFRGENWSCCFSQNSSSEEIFIYTGLDEYIKICKIENGQLSLLDSFQVPQSQAIPHVRSHPNLPLIAGTTLTGSTSVWNFEKKQKVIEEHFSSCMNWASFFVNENTLCLPSTNNISVCFRDVETSKEKMTFNTKSPHITAANSSVTGMIACCNPDGVVEIFDTKSGKLVYMLEGHAMPVRSLEYSSDGVFLATGAQDSLVKLYDGRNSSFIGSLSSHLSWITCVAFKPDTNDYFVTCSYDGSIKVWDPQTLTCLNTFNTFERGVWCAAFNKPGSKFMAVGESYDICAFNA